MSGDDDEIEASRAPLLEHLVELRQRLIVCVAALIVGFLVCFYFADPIFQALVFPYEVAEAMAAQKAHAHGPFDMIMALTGLKPLPVGLTPPRMVYTSLLELFFNKVKLAGFGAIILTFPVLASQLYRFVAPGLYKRERRAFLPFLIASPVLFVMGAALVYFIILPFVLWFALSQQIVTAAIRVELLPKVADYVDQVTKLLIAFGLCFQLPVILALAGLAGLVNAKQLAGFRRYALLGVVVVAALVTPPDPFSQCLLAVPIYGLYELSILCVWLIELRRKREDETEN